MLLFYHNVTIEDFVPPYHELRQIDNNIDFDFVYNEVEVRYEPESRIGRDEGKTFLAMARMGSRMSRTRDEFHE